MRASVLAIASMGFVLSVMCGCGGGSGAPPAAELRSIQVSPATASIAKGLTQQFIARGQYTNGTTQDLSGAVTWTASQANAVSINAVGLVRGLAEGTVTVTATSGSISGTAQLTVLPAQLSSLSITVASKLMLGEAAPLQAIARYTDDSTQDVTAMATWRTRNPSVLSITGTSGARRGAVSGTEASGAATANANQVGVTLISASVSGKDATAKVVVLGYPRFAYIANQLNDSVAEYTVDSDTGRLRPLGYAFTVTTAFTNCFTVHPSGKFGYAVNFWPEGGQHGAQPSISIFSIAPDGALTPIGTPVTVPTRPACVQIDPTGSYAYIPGADAKIITGYSIDSQSGQLSVLAGSPWSIPDETWNVIIDPSGKFLYAGITAGIVGFALDRATGALTGMPGSPFAAWPNGNTVAIEPSGQYAYVTNPNARDITALKMDSTTGALTEIEGARLLTGGLNPQRPVFDRTGQFIYVPNMAGTWGTATGNIGAFKIDPATGKLTSVPGSPFAAGEIPKDAAVDVDGLGKYFYVTDGSNYVRAYEIDGASGALTYLDRFATRRGASGMTLVSGKSPVSYQPQYAWVLHDSGISTVGFDPASALNVISTATLEPGGAALAVERRVQWAYVANPVTNRVNTFAISGTGALSAFYDFDIFGAGPISVLADGSGHGVYVANPLTNSISAFGHVYPGQINPVSDGHADVAQIPAGQTPSRMAIDPNDQYLYVANNGDGTVSRYDLRPFYGSPTQITWGPQPSPTPFATDVKAMVAEPTGKYVYVAAGNSILGFWIDYANNAALEAISGFPSITVTNPAAMTVDETRNMIFVAAADGVHRYAIDSASGKLSETGTLSTTGTAPVSVAVDGSGSWLLVVDRRAGVQPFAIDRQTGGLTPYPVLVTGSNPVAIALSYLIQ